MENENNIQKELLEVSAVLTQVGNANVYSIAAEYFDSLPAIVLSKIQADAEPFYDFTTANPYVIPSSYFDQLPQLVLQIVTGTQLDVESELAHIAPLLNSIDKKNLYATPANYFDTLVPIVALDEKPAAKVLAISSLRKFAKYAAAAVVTGALAIGAYRITGKETIQAVPDINASATVNNLSEDDILNYLKNQPSGNAASASYSASGKENDIRESVSEIPDNDIQQFLQENGDGEDI